MSVSKHGVCPKHVGVGEAVKLPVDLVVDVNVSYLGPYVSTSAHMDSMTPATPASTPGSPCRFTTPHVSWERAWCSTDWARHRTARQKQAFYARVGADNAILFVLKTFLIIYLPPKSTFLKSACIIIKQDPKWSSF